MNDSKNNGLPSFDMASRVSGDKSKKSDDLEVINGIGPKYARALYAIGIDTYPELAICTSAELAKWLAAETGVRIPAHRIDAADWIGQAKKLSVASVQDEANLSRGNDLLDGNDLAKQTTDWLQHAGFSVFFDKKIQADGSLVWQTRVYHDESGEEIQLNGVDCTSWSSWVLARTGLMAFAVKSIGENVGENAKAGYSQSSLADFQIEITKIDVSSVLVPDEGQKALVSKIHFAINQTDAKQVNAKITNGETGSTDRPSIEKPNTEKSSADMSNLNPEDNDGESDQPMPCQVDIHTIDLNRGTTNLIASELADVTLGRRQHTVQHQFMVPDPGQYDLQYTVQMRGPRSVFAAQRGPRLRVLA